jgi:Electron transfer flavoprotein, beta subunit
MKIVVCVKAVPTRPAGGGSTPLRSGLDRSSELTLSDFDGYAVEEALQIGGEVVVLSMGPERALDALRKALAMGADRAVLVSDESLPARISSEPRRRLRARSSRSRPTWCSSGSSPRTAAAPACGPRSRRSCAGPRSRRRAS